MLAAIATIRLPGRPPGQSQICDPSNIATYCFIKPAICQAGDTMSLPGLDFTGQPCDALTLTLQFDAVLAQLDPLERPIEITEAGCSEGWKDSCPGDAAICPQ